MSHEQLQHGLMRQQLLEYAKIQEEEILARDLQEFDAIKIFNAMLRFDSEEIVMQNIVG